MPDDKLPGGSCQYLSTQVVDACPGAERLTPETAAAYQCSETCAKTIVSIRLLLFLLATKFSILNRLVDDKHFFKTGGF